MNDRPSWKTYFAAMAHLASKRATCPRAQVGCVIVKDNHAISMGYNGAPPGQVHCDHTQGRQIHDNHCTNAVHAEANAVADAARRGVALAGSVAYVTLKPCHTCEKLLTAAGIVRIEIV